jgi:hypothetical protein
MNGFEIQNSKITTSSDARLKTNIKNAEVDALNVINQIELKEFDWIQSGEHESLGIIAQQLQTICPELVKEDEDTGMLSIKTTQFIPYLIKAIQDLSSYIIGDAGTFALHRPWVDPYSDEEKRQFVSDLPDGNCSNEPIQLQEVEHTPITLPVD